MGFVTPVTIRTKSLGIGQLPAQARFSLIAGVALLAGIGFTMTIFNAVRGLLFKRNQGWHWAESTESVTV